MEPLLIRSGDQVSGVFIEVEEDVIARLNALAVFVKGSSNGRRDREHCGRLIRKTK